MKSKAFLFIILSGLLWGSSGVFVKFLSPYGFTPLQMTFVRGFIAFVGLSLYALIFDRSMFVIKPKRIFAYAAVGVLLFSTAVLYYTAIGMTSIPTAVVLMYTSPIYVTAFSALFLGEKLTLPKAGAIGLMLVGSALVSGIVGNFSADLLGIIIGLLSGVIYAAYNIVAKILFSKGDNPKSVSLYSFLFMALTASFFSQPAALADRIAQKPTATLPLLIGLGVCTYVLPFFLYNISLKTLSAGTASALGVIEPMAATVYSIVIFRDIPDVYSIIGIVMVLAAVVLIGVIENRHMSEKEAT